MTTYLAHISDLHIPNIPHIPLFDLMNKRLLGMLNFYIARSDIHNMEVLKAIIADVRAKSPDYVAITGDLTNVGHGSEFAQALKIVQSLGDEGKVFLIPGNHDAYVKNSLEDMYSYFSPYMRGDDYNGAVSYPYLRKRDGIAFIGVNSGIPTLPFMATGEVGEKQAKKLASILEKTGKEGLFRVLMIHHPPLPNMSRFGRWLIDASKIQEILCEYGVELVLHGHDHKHSSRILETKTGKAAIIGVASASAIPGTLHHLAEYHWIEIEPASRKFKIERRGISTSEKTIRVIEAKSYK